MNPRRRLMLKNRDRLKTLQTISEAPEVEVDPINDAPEVLATTIHSATPNRKVVAPVVEAIVEAEATPPATPKISPKRKN